MNDVSASGPMNGDANGENATRTAGVSGLHVNESHAKLMKTNKPHHKFQQFVPKENFGVSCFCIRLSLMVRLVMTSLIP